MLLYAAVGDSRGFVLPTTDLGRSPALVGEEGGARLDVRDPGGVLGFAGSCGVAGGGARCYARHAPGGMAAGC